MEVEEGAAELVREWLADEMAAGSMREEGVYSTMKFTGDC